MPVISYLHISGKMRSHLNCMFCYLHLLFILNDTQTSVKTLNHTKQKVTCEQWKSTSSKQVGVRVGFELALKEIKEPQILCLKTTIVFFFYDSKYLTLRWCLKQKFLTSSPHRVNLKWLSLRLEDPQWSNSQSGVSLGVAQKTESCLG